LRDQFLLIWEVIGNFAEATMTYALIGALLVFAGVVYLAARAIWQGPLIRRRRSAIATETLEPRRRGSIVSASDWPGHVLIVLGALLLLAGAFI
jgi:hypothetical protein